MTSLFPFWYLIMCSQKVVTAKMKYVVAVDQSECSKRAFATALKYALVFFTTFLAKELIIPLCAPCGLKTLQFSPLSFSDYFISLHLLSPSFNIFLPRLVKPNDHLVTISVIEKTSHGHFVELDEIDDEEAKEAKSILESCKIACDQAALVFAVSCLFNVFCDVGFIRVFPSS